MSADDGAGAPLYHRIKRELRAAITRGEYDPGLPFISQREVCERFQVSTTTAVRALNDLVAEGVLVRRQGRGTFVAEQTGQTAQTRQTGRTGRTGQPAAVTGSGSDSGTIACIVHGLNGPHNAAVVSGVESACAELGYRMFLSDSDGVPEREERALRQAIETGAAGVVLYPVQGRHHPEVFAELRTRGIPVVLVDRYRSDLAVDAVVPDNFAIGHGITERLIERGHRAIGLLWSETECTSVRDRLAGHQRSLLEHGLPLRPELSLLQPYWTQHEGSRAEVLEPMLASADPPTVLLCANGFVLAAVASALLTLGIAIPDELELAGMDNAGPFDLLPLTTVAAALPSKQMGRRAMSLLVERIGSSDAYREPRHEVLPVEIRTRDETAGYLQAVSASTRGVSASR